MSASTVRVQVLLSPPEAERLDAFCRERGYKKSTLIARLIREHLDRKGFPEQPSLFERPPPPAGTRSRR
jgi:hypothetical protein